MAKARIVLEDGTEFVGLSIGVRDTAVGEVVFNTAMTGYQEILSDPSYAQQIINFTCTHIGNVGVNTLDMEAEKVWASGMIVRDSSIISSSWRMENNLSQFLKQHKIVGITDIDTRKLTRIIRDKGALKACISAEDISYEQALEKAQAFAGLKGMDLAKVVTTKKKYHWTEGCFDCDANAFNKPQQAAKYRVVVYDFGVKRSILRHLVETGCEVQVVPAATSVKDILKLKPDGVLLSNGPGDPEACEYAISNIKELFGTGIPLFGICLGYQLLALASGAQTEKMKFGHHGANHPIQEIDSQQVLISSQNHGFAVAEASLPSDLQITHRSLFDHTIQGIRHKQIPAFGLQGHPEAGPGPLEATKYFKDFIALMAQYKEIHNTEDCAELVQNDADLI